MFTPLSPFLCVRGAYSPHSVYRIIADMMRSNRLWLILFLVVIAACSDSQDAPDDSATDETEVFRRGNGAEPETLDPHRATGTPAYNVLRDLFEGLTTESVTADLEPGAAESWEISEDGTRYVFHLQPAGRWSNGDPVTAHDFVAGFRRTVSPSTGSPNAQLLLAVRNAQGVIRGDLPVEHLGIKALTDSDLEIVLTAPTPYFLGLLNHSATYPVHPSVLENADKAFGSSGRLISNGPYRLTEWRPNEHIELEKNPYYWNSDAVAIEAVRFYPIEDAGTELRKYRAGELDFTIEIPPGQLEWVQEHLKNELHVAPYLGTYYYVLNLHKPALGDNRKLRQALSMAIDRRVIAEAVTGRGEIPAYGWVPPGVNNYRSQTYDWQDLNQETREETARRLYKEAGHDASNPFRTTILYDSSAGHKQVALAVAAMWQEVLGVEAVLDAKEWKVFLDTRRSPELWEISRLGWVGDYNDANAFLEIFLSDHNQNVGGYASPRYDSFTEAASLQTNPEKRRRRLEQAERILLEDYPIIPVYFYVSKHLVKPRVEGYQPNIMNHSYTRHYRLKPSGPH